MTKNATDTGAHPTTRTRLAMTGLLGALVSGFLSPLLAIFVALGTLGLMTKRPQPARHREPLLWDDGFERI